jgi:hypothetical protein
VYVASMGLLGEDIISGARVVGRPCALTTPVVAAVESEIHRSGRVFQTYASAAARNMPRDKI